MFNFKKERLCKKEHLGGGAFGDVYPYKKVPDDSTDFKWVVKRLKTKTINKFLGCLPEIILGFSCDHPCIVPIKGYSIQSKGNNQFNVHLKLPRMTGGNFAQELENRKKDNLYFSESELVKHFYCLLSAVDYLHNKKIVHGDIKNDNILLDDKKTAKLSDIGSAKYVPEEDQHYPMAGAEGLDKYRAPEILSHETALREYNSLSEEEKKNFQMERILKKDGLFLVDSWSLGLAMLEACLLKSTKVHSRDLLSAIQEKLKNERKEANKKYKDIFLNIIFGLLKTDPKERLKVSAARKELVENFKDILTEEFKMSLGIQKQSKKEILDINDYLETFNESANKILKIFEENKEAKETQFDSFKESLHKLQERLNAFDLQIEVVKPQESQENKENKEYEKIIQDLTQKNSNLLEKLRGEQNRNRQIGEQNQKIKSLCMKKHCQPKLTKVSTKLREKWDQLFEIKGEDYLFVQQRYYYTYKKHE